MARITDFNIIDTPAQNVLVIENHLHPHEFITFFIGCIYKLDAYIRQKGSIPADIPYMRVWDNGSQHFTLTTGTSIAEPLEGDDETIIAKTIPAGKKMVWYFQGNNDQMGPAYEEAESFLAENGYRRNGAYYEYFLNGTEYGVENLLTKVVCEIE